MLGEEAAADVWASTFHSACVRILRRDIDRIGFDRSFTIYDSDDSKRVVKDILKELGLEEKSFPPREVLVGHLPRQGRHAVAGGISGAVAERSTTGGKSG